MTTSRFLSEVHDVSDADEAYAITLDSLLTRGLEITDGSSPSVAAGKKFREILNFSLVMRAPAMRLVQNDARRINLPAAVARFVWMMAGSDRLADIAFYEPKVRFFTDDGISIPGSNYGQRILQPRPGLNQLVAVIERLRQNPTSRRAAISIYHPEDAVRSSRDIPCAFGVFYHVREGELHATTLMRSNNAFILLPYNLFEFSLLAEVVAAELRVNLATLTHMSASMHLFEENWAVSREIVEAEKHLKRAAGGTIPSMPTDDPPVEQVRELVRLEADLRHASAGLGERNIEDFIRRGEEKLSSYWRQLYYLLAVHVARRNESVGALERLRSVLISPWVDYLPEETFEVAGGGARREGDLLALELAPDSPSVNVIPLHATRTHRELRSRAETWESNTGGSLTWRTFVKLEEHFAGQVAARGDLGISQTEFELAVREMQGGAASDEETAVE